MARHHSPLKRLALSRLRKRAARSAGEGAQVDDGANPIQPHSLTPAPLSRLHASDPCHLGQ
ncbi:hypothetical protein WQQ_36310 [Hydrocarboniphaga effusa AP103]|uniref:Uncharacterized protein n=1 Tax=Hydrocarboniphaga effusa AP103 TaxID=1172194 RepID=I8HY97_9GAMM|nr:hypothetical protein WQQ_36310 [Hydrocarboniphaga effusa AP103]